MNTILTVSQINAYIKSLIDYDGNLNNIYVSGEISNFTNHYRTGHFYFTLKDDNTAIKAVMFSQNARLIRFEPYNGLKVLVRARVSVFERDGVYQLYVTDMQPDGLGQLNLAYEQLKERLEKEGLFSQEYKKPIPEMPKRIAVITSPTGAAIQDIINVISRRYSCCELIIVPVQVQGENSAPQIVRALKKVNELNAADVIILGRGGGSIEDLWSFNEEAVARAVFASEIPVISAVGHETDFTISDFVADMRAPTPSAAAELATPDIRAVYNSVHGYSAAMESILNDKLISCRSALENLTYQLNLFSPENRLKSESEKLSMLNDSLNMIMKHRLEICKGCLSVSAEKLDALSPLKTLLRGFTLTFDEAGNHIGSAKKITNGQRLRIKFKDGDAICRAEEVI